MTGTLPVSHPGNLLMKKIHQLGMSQRELAIRTGMTEKHISTVINGDKDVSAVFARRLDVALGEESGTWAKHQLDYDQYMIAFGEANGITDEELAILKAMKEIVDYFLSCGIMHNHCGDSEKILQLRQILRVNNLTVIPQISYNAAYRAQIKTNTKIDPYILFAWQRMCEIKSEKEEITNVFDANKLYHSLSDIKKIMFEQQPNKMVSDLKCIFKECGISFDVVHHFRGAPVQGFIKKADQERVLLCLTIRGKKADRFWFSLFHEIGHLLNGDLDTRFVDFDSVRSVAEEKADAFARDILIPSTDYLNFIRSQKYIYLSEIKSFAKTIGVPYWVVIGRLHNDEWLDWSSFANEIPGFEWAK